MVSSVLVIFDNVDTYSCFSNKGFSVDLEEKILQINLKGIYKGLNISGFLIIEYSVRSESGCMVALRDQAYYVPGLPKYWRIIYPQGIRTSAGQKYKSTEKLCVTIMLIATMSYEGTLLSF